MCGRTGLNLNRDSIRCACAYKPAGRDAMIKPDYVEEYNCGKSFQPSTNIAPTEVTPVLLSRESSHRILKPMMWGMVPPWHKGDCNKHGLTTNNCRIENIMTSKLYGAALRDGKRCVVVAEGFYEWQTTNQHVKTKQPYFIYSAPHSKANDDDASSSVGTPLLKMAALYNTWEGSEGILYSYSIITMQSNDTLSWLHHRMPAILDQDDDVEKWLDPTANSREVVSILKPTTNLSWHPVSTLVNNSRNKSEECNKRIDIEKKESASQKIMAKWLNTKTKRQNVTNSRNNMNNWLTGKRKSDESHADGKKFKEE